jgi:hypothetical protein
VRHDPDLGGSFDSALGLLYDLMFRMTGVSTFCALPTIRSIIILFATSRLFETLLFPSTPLLPIS